MTQQQKQTLWPWIVLIFVVVGFGASVAKCQQGTFGGAVKFADYEGQTAAFTAIVPNVGQGNHVLVIHFPAEGATVAGLQIRLEAGFVTDTSVSPPTISWFPISPDITEAPLQTSGEVFSVLKANGTFYGVRVNSLNPTPGGELMNVHYIGSPFPISSIEIVDGQIIENITGGGGGGKVVTTGILCNGADCATGTNLTNEVIVLSAADWTACDAYVKTAPTGADLIIDVNLNGSTILTSPITIPAGFNRPATTVTSFAIASTAERDRVTFDIDQIGATAAGRDLTVTCIGDVQ